MNLVRVALKAIAIALVFALGTAWYGWWTVPLLAFVYAIADDAQRHRGWLAAAAAVLSWAAILAAGASRGIGMWSNGVRVASLLHTSPALLGMLTLAFAALLAGPAAVIGASVRSAGGRRASA